MAASNCKESKDNNFSIPFSIFPLDQYSQIPEIARIG